MDKLFKVIGTIFLLGYQLGKMSNRHYLIAADRRLVQQQKVLDSYRRPGKISYLTKDPTELY